MKSSLFFRAAALTLVLALSLSLAACGKKDEPAAAGSTPPASSAPAEETPAPAEPTPTEAAEPVEDGFEEILDGLIGFGPGTAGSSLSSVDRAAQLLNWASQFEGADLNKLSIRVDDWFQALSDRERANLKETWPMVRDAARGMIDDPAAFADRLEDAGAKLDPETPNGEAFEALADMLDVILLYMKG